MSLVEVKTFPSLHEAELACEFLKAQGIEAFISGQDSMRPHLNFTTGIKLMVNEENFEKAKELFEKKG